MWVLKLQTDEGIYRIPSPIEQPTFELLVAALTKFGQDVDHARYIDEDGDQCILNEATFPDFLEFAVQGPSKAKVLKLVMTTPSESSWTTLSSQNVEDKAKHGKVKRARRGKQDRHRGRSRSSSRGTRGSRRGRRNRRSRSRSSSSSSSSSGHSSSSSGSSRSRSSSRGSERSDGRFHGCSSCRFQKSKITFMLKESFRSRKSAKKVKTLIPGGSKAVQRAFYGDAEHAWGDSKGKDVTEAVKAILDCGQHLRAQNDVFGDPAPGVEKMLIVEAAIPPRPVSLAKAEGFIKALRDEYVNNVKCGVGKFFDNSTEDFERFETAVLESFEKMVRSADSCDEAISMLARSWGVQHN